MASKTNKQAMATLPTGNAPLAPVVLVVGKAPRNATHTNTKHGQGGTAGTWAAIFAHITSNGSITYTALQALCIAQGDKGYAAYALSHKWLVPSTPAA